MRTTSRRFNSRSVAAFFATLCAVAMVWAPCQARAAALPNVLVNQPALDNTARDSQQETTLALGAGNTIYSAYVDSGSWDNVPGGANDHFIGLSMSPDGGTNWIDLGTLPDTIRGDGMNPVLVHGA
ncbi:MAG: hypothetical protein QOF48_4025, partial [Verrucomicrobiota bacterium]